MKKNSTQFGFSLGGAADYFPGAILLHLKISAHIEECIAAYPAQGKHSFHTGHYSIKYAFN